VDGTLIRTDRCHVPGPTARTDRPGRRVDLWWSGKHAPLTDDQRTVNLLHAATRAPAERGNSLLKTTFKALRRGQPLPLAHRRHHRRRPRATPPRARPHHMINEPAKPLLRMAQWDSARSGGGRRGARSATIVVMTTESLRAVRDHLSEVIDRVEHQHERVVITRNGRAAAVLISPEDLEALEETLSVLNDPEALADIREADAAYARGDVTRGVEAVRQLRQ
jgi:antitoxin YefM